ncbi:MAG: T9SS type A sorting domain-containing protein [Bacteroidetes bacterium]|nr:T9SS type A sorting domain-containing protein [Bacteroidota bacterium]
MKHLILLICLLSMSFIGESQELNSVNVLGSRFMADNSSQLFKTIEDEYLVFGSSANMGVVFTDFYKGASNRLFIHSNHPDLPMRELQGAGGIAENDTTFVLIGQFEIPEQNAQVIVVKVTISGRVLWAKMLNTSSNDYADKIILCKNGDYLVSILSNQREDIFGNRVSGSAIFRITAAGNLLWYSNIDSRVETNSKVLSMFEIGSENLVIFQSYSDRLSLLKLTSTGDSLASFLSDDSLLPSAATFISDSSGFFIVTQNSDLLKIDTSLIVNTSRHYSNTNLSKFTSVLTVNDSVLAIGGKYLSDACILNVNPITFQVRELYHNSFFPYAGSDIQGMFVVDDTFYSLLSNGFALSKHKTDLSHDCFEQLDGSQIIVTTQSSPSIDSGQSILISNPNFDNVLGIYCVKDSDKQPSANCLDYDLSIRTEFLEYDMSCRNILLKYYVYNHGKLPIDSFEIITYFSDTTIRRNFVLDAPIVEKTGVYVDFGEYYLNIGNTLLSYKVFSPNGMQDQFPYNDSFFTEFKTISNVTIGISASDSICKNSFNVFTTQGPDGTYSLFKNDTMVIQGTNRTYSTDAGGGIYRFRYEDTKGCRFYSDTMFVKELDLPLTPSLTVSNDTLFSDASGDVYWYFNNVLSDSNTSFLVYKGAGNYKVVTKNASGCTAQNEILNLVLNIEILPTTKPFYFSQNTLFWNSDYAANVELYSFDGRLIDKFIMDNKFSSYKIHKPVGLYFLQISSANRFYTEKIIIVE